jgi:hypothetical protein
MDRRSIVDILVSRERKRVRYIRLVRVEGNAQNSHCGNIYLTQTNECGGMRLKVVCTCIMMNGEN